MLFPPRARRAAGRKDGAGRRASMADLSKITVESLPEAALLVRRWRVAQANAAARHYIPALREEGPLPQGLRPLLSPWFTSPWWPAGARG